MIIKEISDFKKDELRYELRNEPPNNFAVYINGKKWKVFKGNGIHADDSAEEQHFAQLKRWAQKKSRETGKDWQVGKTGEPVSEGSLVFHKESELRGMLDTLLKSWKQEEHTPDEFAKLLNALGYDFKKQGDKAVIVKKGPAPTNQGIDGALMNSAEEPNKDTSARAKLNHSLVSQGHRVEKDKKKELKKGAVKHKGKLYNDLVSIEKTRY